MVKLCKRKKTGNFFISLRPWALDNLREFATFPLCRPVLYQLSFTHRSKKLIKCYVTRKPRLNGDLCLHFFFQFSWKWRYSGYNLALLLPHFFPAPPPNKLKNINEKGIKTRDFSIFIKSLNIGRKEIRTFCVEYSLCESMQ